MSRAFMKELDGWNYCRSHHRECSDAAFNGSCERTACKYRAENPKDDSGTDTVKQQLKNTK